MNTKTSSSSIATRIATACDCESLTQLCFRSKQSNGYDDAFMEACREELTITPATLAENECWVAHTEHTLCGCGCLSITAALSRGEISLFFIDPDWQRQGVGTLLWHTLQERARHHQLKELWLDADPSAQEFYSSLGFRVVGQSASGSIVGRYLPKMQLTDLQHRTISLTYIT